MQKIKIIALFGHSGSGKDTIQKWIVSHYPDKFNGIVSCTTRPERENEENGKEIPIYKTHKIIGTVISKNDNKNTVTLLTTSGVVSVKFTKDYYAMFGRQISERQDDGSKKVMEKGWFGRGNKLMITGFRRDDMFVAKRYTHTPTHQLYKIDLVNGGRDMELLHERYGLGEEE